MRKFILGLFLSPLLAFAPAGSHDLTVSVSNVKNRSGNITIGLFNTAARFPKENGEYRKVTLKAVPGLTYTFKNIPDGDYAIALMHDENADGKCNFNILGIPTEGYGFSNNVRPKFSAPSFSSARFSVSADKALSISLIY